MHDIDANGQRKPQNQPFEEDTVTYLPAIDAFYYKDKIIKMELSGVWN